MATTRNIQMQYYNGTDYDTLYPMTNLSNITGSLNAINVSYSNSSTSSIITGDNVQLAIDQLFQSVSNGKSQIASAITDMGVSTSGNDTWEAMANNIKSISTGNPVCLTSPFGNDSVTATYVGEDSYSLRITFPSKFEPLTLIGFGFYFVNTLSANMYGFGFDGICYYGTYGNGTKAKTYNYVKINNYINITHFSNVTLRSDIVFMGIFQ